MATPQIAAAGKYTDVHAENVTGGETPTEAMNTSKKSTSFWEGLNVRLVCVNMIIVAVVTVAMTYTAQMVFQVRAEDRIAAIENTIKERSPKRDKQIDDINDKLDRMVTKDELKLNIDPIVSQQKDIKSDLGEIKSILLHRQLNEQLP